jgi:hypothetical protein
MTAYRLFCELSRVAWWAEQSRKVRWLAARYYIGVDSAAVLRELVPDMAETIIDLR